MIIKLRYADHNGGGADMSNRKLGEIQKVLFDAADTVERREYCKNRYIDDRGRVCLQKAIMVAAGRHLDAAMVRLRSYLALSHGMVALDRNNRPERTEWCPMTQHELRLETERLRKENALLRAKLAYTIGQLERLKEATPLVRGGARYGGSGVSDPAAELRGRA